MIRFPQRALTLPLVLLLSAFAHAGHWQVTYSGGYYTDTAPQPHDDGPRPGGWGGQGRTAYGPIKAKFKWVGDFTGDYSMPPSLSFYVHETCSASAESYTPAPAPQADNGLGSQKTTNTQQIAPGYTKTIVWCSGERYTRKNVSGTNLEFEVTASPSASGSSGYGGGASVVYSAEIVEYAVGISSDRDVTYRKENGLRVANDLDTLTPRFGDTAVSYWYSLDAFGNLTGEGFNCNPRFDRVLIGGTDAFNQWSCPPETWQDGPLSENTWISPLWQYSVNDVLGWVSGGGPSKVVTLTVTDDYINALTATGTYTMRLHAPAENIVEGTKTQEYGPEKLAYTLPGPSDVDVHFSQTIAISSTSSKTVKFGLEGSGQFDVKLVEMNLKASYGVEWGKSATVSKTTSVDFTIPKGQSAFIVGKPTWKAWNVTWDAFGANGYIGPASSRATSWISGTVAAAEGNFSNDYVWRVVLGNNTGPTCRQLVRLAAATALVAAQSRAGAQILDIDRGLRAESVGTIDYAGYVPWSSVESLTEFERQTVTLLVKRDFLDAEKLARSCVGKGPGRLVAHSLLLQATVGLKSREKLRALVDSYRKPVGGAMRSVEQIAYSRALAVETANLTVSTPDDWQRSETALARTATRLDPKDVVGAIALADAWSSGATGNFSKARRIMESAVKANPSSVPARYFLLVLYSRGILASNDPAIKNEKPRPDLVIREAEAIIGLNASFRQAYYFGGLAKLQNGDKPGAADWLRKYRALNPYKKGDYYNTAGAILKTLGQSQ